MFKQFNPGEMLPARAERIASGSSSDPPSFTVSMARKDARLMIEEAARHNVPLGVISGRRQALRRGDRARRRRPGHDRCVPLPGRLTAGAKSC